MRLTIPLIMLLAVSGAQAGDWMLSEGHSNLGVAYSHATSDTDWDTEANPVAQSCTTADDSMSLRYEYGYSYYRTLFASTSYKNTECGGYQASGVSDLKLGVRGRINPFRNGYSWQVTAIIPLQDGRFTSSKDSSDYFGLDLGVFRSYRPDPYTRPLTVIREGVWGWGLGLTLWEQDIGHQGWGELKWTRQLDKEYKFKASLGATKAITIGENGVHGAVSTARSKGYDVVNASVRLSRKLSRDLSLGASLKQDLWGRNTSQDTTIEIELSTSWD